MRFAEQQALPQGPFSRRTYFGDTPWDKRASEELGYEFVAVGAMAEHSLGFEDLKDTGALLAVLGSSFGKGQIAGI